MLTEEEIDDLLAEQQHVADSLGMINYDHFLTFKENTSKGLKIFGSKFESLLGILLECSETKDAIKIIRTWQNQCTQYEMLYRIHEAKQKALE